MRILKLNLGKIMIDKLSSDDLNAYFELMCNEYIAKYCGFTPVESKDKAKMLLDSDIADDTVAIRNSDSNKLIGLINLFENIGANNEPLSTELDLGYLIQDEYSHKGYMTLALSKVIELLKCKSRVEKIFATFKKENIGSMKVLKNNGFAKCASDSETETWVLNLK
ncbi:GNAT family N-acetyltransferase [Apilactobacillus ozensis]|uniref:GNAT family N-acetyltransferase n=1 Tax=Apilactobacillus ozensis TaxID=866801 RepID=UPI00200A8A65|nr:GNAT family N-acetyltransferase [Apilactobacillus ozensis]MCK8606688.1 GNAT family N-acetyltransferase [Apilactobacillus ozensis]